MNVNFPDGSGQNTTSLQSMSSSQTVSLTTSSSQPAADTPMMTPTPTASSCHSTVAALSSSVSVKSSTSVVPTKATLTKCKKTKNIALRNKKIKVDTLIIKLINNPFFHDCLFSTKTKRLWLQWTGVYVTSWRPCWRSRKKAFLSSGNLTLFSDKFFKNKFYCIDLQYGRLVTWLQTKN